MLSIRGRLHVRYFLQIAVLLLTAAVLLRSLPAAEVSAEQRKQLSALRTDVNKVPVLLREKKLDDAESALKSAEATLQEIATAVGVPVDDRSLMGVATLIKKQRDALAKLRGKAGGKADDPGISFSRDVAPIVAGVCLDCHSGQEARANLRLDTFAGWKRGGRSGPLLVIGNADNSLLMRAVRATDPTRRMPKDADALSDSQIKTLGDWINAGARYDGQSNDLALADVIADAPLDPNVEIPKPKGTETVSFTRDIAPFMSNLCGGCHSRQRMSGGLCLDSFYDMMRGGASGVVVLPGNREESRLFRLTGGLENPRMPQGQARITRKNYEDLKTWFDEGCVYDGEDPKAPLRSFVKSAAEIEADKFAAMAPEELRKLRVDRTQEQFKRALPNDTANVIETDELYLIGNASPERLQQVADWSGLHTAKLQKLFDHKQGGLWKGRLAVFVMKDRFSYDEFNLVIEQREAARELTGHSVIKPTFEDAYVVLLDVGDEAGEEQPTLQMNLIDHLTGAFLKRDGKPVPVWVQRGLGMVLSAQSDPGNPYFRKLPARAKAQVGALGNPAEVFVDGTFSPEALVPVAYTLVDYMLDEGGAPRFTRFAGALGRGQDLAGALRSIYDSDADRLARAYLKSLN